MKVHLAIFQAAPVDHDFPERPYGTIFGGWILLRGRKHRLYATSHAETHGILLCERGVIHRVLVTYDDPEPRRSLPTTANAIETGYLETPFMTVPLAYRNTSTRDKLEVLFIVVQAVSRTAPCFDEMLGFERIGGATLNLPCPEDWYALKYLQLPACSCRAVACICGGFEDILLLL